MLTCVNTVALSRAEFALQYDGIRSRFMQDGRARYFTKLNVSKSSFDYGWIDAIEETGRRD